MAKHLIASMTALENWVGGCREGGSPSALEFKPKGRPRAGDVPPRTAAREEGFEAEDRRLKVEATYLKTARPEGGKASTRESCRICMTTGDLRRMPYATPAPVLW